MLALVQLAILLGLAAMLFSLLSMLMRPARRRAGRGARRAQLRA